MMVEQSRTHIVGMDLPDMESCAGPPLSELKISDNEKILVFSTVSVSTPTVSASLPIFGDALKPTITASSTSMCRMTARVISNKVYSIHYLDNSFFGGYSSCAPLIRDCMKHPDTEQQKKAIRMAVKFNG